MDKVRKFKGDACAELDMHLSELPEAIIGMKTAIRTITYLIKVIQLLRRQRNALIRLSLDPKMADAEIIFHDGECVIEYKGPHV